MKIYDWPAPQRFILPRDRDALGIADAVFPEQYLPEGMLDLRGDEIEPWILKYRNDPDIDFREGFLTVFYGLEILSQFDKTAKDLFQTYISSLPIYFPFDYVKWAWKRKPEEVLAHWEVFNTMQSRVQKRG